MRQKKVYWVTKHNAVILNNTKFCASIGEIVTAVFRIKHCGFYKTSVEYVMLSATLTAKPSYAINHWHKCLLRIHSRILMTLSHGSANFSPLKVHIQPCQPCSTLWKRVNVYHSSRTSNLWSSQKNWFILTSGVNCQIVWMKMKTTIPLQISSHAIRSSGLSHL